jgi:hypothetical protein
MQRMKLDSIYKAIQKENDKLSIFHSGPFNLCPDSKRIYLDEFGLEKKDLLPFLKKYVYELIEPVLGQTFYVCLVSNSEDKINIFPQDSLNHLESCKIETPIEFVHDNEYIHEDEWYNHYLFYKETGSNLQKYINGILGHLIKTEPYLDMEVFFIDNSLKTLINLYDDRGIDIVNLK